MMGKWASTLLAATVLAALEGVAKPRRLLHRDWRRERKQTRIRVRIQKDSRRRNRAH